MGKNNCDSKTYVKGEEAKIFPDKASNSENCRYKVPDDIWREERKLINKRRENFKLPGLPEDDDKSGGKPSAVPIFGLALSGGGIRSATFSLGVMQAMAKEGIMKYVDILSTVSGGGFIGSSLSWLSSGRGGNVGFGMNSGNFPYGTDVPYGIPPDPADSAPIQQRVSAPRGTGSQPVVCGTDS